MSNQLVCLCNGVTENEIFRALKKGARSTSEIQKLTRAGTSCGRCLVVVDGLVGEFLEQLPDDAQTKLDFGI